MKRKNGEYVIGDMQNCLIDVSVTPREDKCGFDLHLSFMSRIDTAFHQKTSILMVSSTNLRELSELFGTLANKVDNEVFGSKR
jgi:ABC-type transporter Mla MlaB component